MRLLLYCTKSRPYLNCDYGLYDSESYFPEHFIYLANRKDMCSEIANGKIVAECDYEVEKIEPYKHWNCEDDYDIHYDTNKLHYDELLEKSCLNNQELDDYLDGWFGYAIHIKNLHIFDEPIKLEKCHNDDFSSVVNYAPQNMMYSWLFTDKWNRYALISIKPEWLYKILNGEKTIEIRKKVLKEMLK